MPRSDRFNKFINNGPSARQIRNASGKPMNSDECPTGDLRAQIRNEGDEVVILLHDAIGDSWEGNDSATVSKVFSQNRGKAIKMDINSFGGSAYDGIAIYNAALLHDAPVNMVITGIAHSAASLIVMAGDKITIAENGSLGIHPASIGVIGNRFTLQDGVEWLTALDEQIVSTYSARTGMTPEDVLLLFVGSDHDGTILSGKDAVEKGFADEMIPLKKKPGKAASSDKKITELRQRIADREQRWQAEQAKQHMAALRKRLMDKTRN